MKAFVIQCRTGYFTLPQKFKSITFPLSTRSTLSNASQFPLRSRAEKIMKKYGLTGHPFFGEVKEIDI